MRVLTFQESLSIRLVLHLKLWDETESEESLYQEWVRGRIENGQCYFSALFGNGVSITPDYCNGEGVHNYRDDIIATVLPERVQPKGVIIVDLLFEPGKSIATWPERRAALESLMESLLSSGRMHRIQAAYCISGGPIQRSVHERHRLDEAFPGSSGVFIALP
jgi:hypothetical protein